MRLLITRAQEDAAPLAALLASHGIETQTDPLLSIEMTAGPALDLAGVQALLMTSANGVRAFCQRNPERRIAVYAVGDATAREARNQGFSQIESAAGDVQSLAGLVRRSLPADGGSLLHCAGSKTAGDLAGDLSAAGYSYRREVLYRAQASRRLHPDTVASLQAGKLDGVLLYSPRTARIFRNGLQQQPDGLAPSLASVTAYCLSPAVAGEIDDLPWKSVAVARQPTQNALLEIVLGRV